MKADEQTIADYLSLLRTGPEFVPPERTQAAMEAADRVGADADDDGKSTRPGTIGTGFGIVGALSSLRVRASTAALMFGLGALIAVAAKLALSHL